MDECNQLTHILESEKFTLDQCQAFFQMATHYIRPRYKMKLVKKLDPPLTEISNTLYAIFGLEVAKEEFIIREIGTRRPLRRVFNYKRKEIDVSDGPYLLPTSLSCCKPYKGEVSKDI